MKKLLLIILTAFLLLTSCALQPVNKDYLEQHLQDYAKKQWVHDRFEEFQTKINRDGYVEKSEVEQLVKDLIAESGGGPNELHQKLLKMLESTAANKIRAFIAKNGGGTGAMDAIACGDLATNDLALVYHVATATMYFYKYDSTATAPESDPTVIEPDDVDTNCAGNGNWELMTVIYPAGDFSGPGSSTDNAFMRFDGTGGKTGQDGNLTEDDDGKIATSSEIALDDATGDEAAMTISYVTNKATSGDDYGLVVDKATDTASPDTSYLFDLRYLGVSKFAVKEDGSVPVGGIEDTITFQDDGDATKKMSFQLSGITAGQTRVITVPDGTLQW